MSDTRCAQCLAARRARRIRRVRTLGAIVCIALCAVPCAICVAMSGLRDAPGAIPLPEALQLQDLAIRFLGAVFALAASVLVLDALALRIDRRAAMPRPRPTPDPLAHYRDGPATECPEHPFGG